MMNNKQVVKILLVALEGKRQKNLMPIKMFLKDIAEP